MAVRSREPLQLVAGRPVQDWIADRALDDGGICVVREEQPNVAYWLLIQPTLFGDVELVRQWGIRWHDRRRPRQRAEAFADLFELEAALRAALARRVRRGYFALEEQPRPADARRRRGSRAWRRCYGAPPERERPALQARRAAAS